MTNKSEILREAKKISSEYVAGKAESELQESDRKAERAEEEAKELCDHIMNDIEAKIMEAASNGKTSLTVMEMCAGIYSWVSEGVNMSRTYDEKQPAHAKAFDLVFEACQEMGLDPVRADVSSYYGESMPTIKTILIAWGKAE